MSTKPDEVEEPVEESADESEDAVEEVVKDEVEEAAAESDEVEEVDEEPDAAEPEDSEARTTLLSKFKNRSRFRFPKSNSWSDFVGSVGRKNYAVTSVIIMALMVLGWAGIYILTSAQVGEIRVNNLVLESQIATEEVVAVSAVGTDGSFVDAKGRSYAEGSFTDTAAVSRYFKTPYYSLSSQILVVPMDWSTLLKMTTQVMIWLVVTVAWFQVDRWSVRKFNRGEKVRDVRFNAYPWWLRLMRGIVIAMSTVTVVSWLWIML